MVLVEDFNLEDRWLQWSNTADGVFLTVRPDILPAERSLERIKDKLIAHRVMNFDQARIAEAIAAATGEAVYVGTPFVRFNDEKIRHLFLQVTPLQVRLAVRSTILTTDLRITRADIDFLLMEKGVVYGIDWETIDYLLQSDVYDQETIIASSDPPVNGKDGEVHETIAVDPDSRPILLDDGSVDYRNLENIRKVGKGDVVCVRIPPTPGIPGKSVYGKPLPPTPGRDIALPAGNGMDIVKDQTQMVASHSGYLYRRNGLIHVGNIYVLHGDVCFKSGNIEYTGDVLIQGSVLSDFKVIADGDITVEGTVEGAELVSRNGSVMVRDSVFGKGKAVIKAARNILVGVAQDCDLEAGEELRVRRYLRNCTCRVETLEASAKDCEVSSCTVHFRKQARCHQLGGRSSSPNLFVLIENEREKYMNQAQELEQAVTRLRMASQDLENKLKVVRIQLKSLLSPGPSPELANQAQLLTSQLQTIKGKLEWADDKRRRTLRFLDVLPDREDLLIAQDLQSVLRVSVYGQEKEYRSSVRKWRIGWKSGAIRMESV